jgi:hypothetical protein
MTRLDHDLAAQVARNVQHVHRLGQLYRIATLDSADAASLRAELAEAAAHAGPAARLIATPAQADAYMVRLHGLAKLAARLRQALAAEGGADG